jgi:hypothetical protein
MKKALFMLVVAAGMFAGCEKETLVPAQGSSSTISTPESTEKESGKNKRILYCEVRNPNGQLLASGQKCAGKGDECGRKTYCTAQVRMDENPGDVVYDNMTREEFVRLWNTDEGMLQLTERGVYEVDLP